LIAPIKKDQLAQSSVGSAPASSAPVGLALVRGLLSGPIDIDKLDYLQRDSLHAGVPYGRNFDQRRLLSSLCVGPTGRDIGITVKGKTAAEMMVFSRYVMFSEVYWHHAVRSGTAMLQRLVFELGSLAQPDEWLAWGDQQMHQQLLQASQSQTHLSGLAHGLFGRQRQLYKRLLEFNFTENPQAHEALARRSYAELVACAGRLAERLSRRISQPLQATDILIDAPPVKLEVQFKLSVKLGDGQYQSLDSLSPVVHALATEQFDNYVKRVHVFIAPERRRDLNLGKEELAEELLRCV
jgi:HD superfamily phosphohydrolase